MNPLKPAPRDFLLSNCTATKVSRINEKQEWGRFKSSVVFVLMQPQRRGKKPENIFEEDQNFLILQGDDKVEPQTVICRKIEKY